MQFGAKLHKVSLLYMEQIHPIDQVKKMEFREVYCMNCKKILGRYNIKFYDDDKIGELLKTTHVMHVRNGHQVNIRKFVKD